MMLWSFCALIAHLSGGVFRIVDRIFLDRCRRLDRDAVEERKEQAVGGRLRVGVEASLLENTVKEQRRHDFDRLSLLGEFVSRTPLCFDED